MTTNTIFKTMDDLVFEDRYKDYGAYELRTMYEKRMFKAMVVAFGIMILFALLPAVYSQMTPETIVEDDCTVIDLSNPPKLEEVVPPPPAAPQNTPPPLHDQMAFNDPTVRDDNEVPKETTPPDQASFANADPGSTTQAGDPNGATVNTTLTDNPGTGTVPVAPAPVEEPKTFNTVEVDQKPMFPQGEAALLKYLAENIQYPAIARESAIQGRVVISFIIDKDGSIENASILRAIGGGCDQEAVRVIKSMPKWQPGKVRGKPVKVKFTLPIMFSLKN